MWFHFLQKVIIVTSSLMKDMNSRTDMYRANAIRVLCRITDGTLLTQIERYLKQAIVDKNPVVASAALVSGIHLLQVRFQEPFFIFCSVRGIFLTLLRLCLFTDKPRNREKMEQRGTRSCSIKGSSCSVPCTGPVAPGMLFVI